MAIARKNLIDPNSPKYYHVNSKCVRRSYLFGIDSISGKNYCYRKKWILARLRLLAKYFYVEVGSYAIMDNHYHLILKNRPDKVKLASDEEIAFRYLSVFRTRWAKKEKRMVPTDEEVELLVADVIKFSEVKERISSISWFQKSLNEYIGRRANGEDGEKGRFFDSRFHSQALLDEKSLMVCSAYVDLNPVRAGMVESVDDFEYTSIFERSSFEGQKSIVNKNMDNSKELKSSNNSLKEISKKIDERYKDSWLAKFKKKIGESHEQNRDVFFPVEFDKYRKVIEFSNAAILLNKSPEYPREIQEVLSIMGISESAWDESIRNYNNLFYLFVGDVNQLKNHVISKKKKWVGGTKNNKRLFSST